MHRQERYAPIFYLLNNYCVNATEQDLYETGAGACKHDSVGRSVAMTGAHSDRNRAVPADGWPQPAWLVCVTVIYAKYGVAGCQKGVCFVAVQIFFSARTGSVI
jgi:hypothetical protein